jgi:hypothetical protein
MEYEIDVEHEISHVVDGLAMSVLPRLRGAAALIETSDAFNDGEELPSALILVADAVRDLADLQSRAEAALVRYTNERQSGVLRLIEARSRRPAGQSECSERTSDSRSKQGD